jgi:hypothetical protein
MAQTSITATPPAYFPGQPGQRRTSDYTTAYRLAVAETVAYGKAIVFDSVRGQGCAHLPDETDFALAGCTFNNDNKSLGQVSVEPTFVQGDSMSAARKMQVVVLCEDDVDPSQPVYFRNVEGVDPILNARGNWRTKDAATASVIVLTFTNPPTSETVTVGGNKVTNDTNDLAAFAGKIAAIPGVLSAVYNSGAHTITITALNLGATGLVVTAAAVTSTETATVSVLTFTAAPDTETVTIDGNVIVELNGDLAAFAGLIAAQNAVASAVYNSGAHTITITSAVLGSTGMTVAGAAVTGAGASVAAVTTPGSDGAATVAAVTTAGDDPVAKPAIGCAWVSVALAGSPALLEINLP